MKIGRIGSSSYILFRQLSLWFPIFLHDALEIVSMNVHGFIVRILRFYGPENRSLSRNKAALM
jgi:hypothetical protein